MPTVEQYLQQHYQGTDLGALSTDRGAGMMLSQDVSFTETTGAGVYTGTVFLPAGSVIVDIKVRSSALWTASTSAIMTVGDANVAGGWFTGINLKATDLLVGEEINFVQTGGKEGAYLVLSTGLRSAAYNAAVSAVLGVVTTVGTTGNAGRTIMTVVYSTDAFPSTATKV